MMKPSVEIERIQFLTEHLNNLLAADLLQILQDIAGAARCSTID
jgi:hypothetical protein